MNQRIAGMILDRMDPTLTPQVLRLYWIRVSMEVTSGWQTEDNPRERITLSEELVHVVFYIA
jgi:hypothetical protein